MLKLINAKYNETNQKYDVIWKYRLPTNTARNVDSCCREGMNQYLYLKKSNFLINFVRIFSIFTFLIDFQNKDLNCI